MDLKELVKTAISETCTHWLISDDADLKKVSKKLTKEFETIINAEIERRQPVSTSENGLHKHVVMASASKTTTCDNCVNYRMKKEARTVGTCLLDDETTWNYSKCSKFQHLP